MKIKELNDKLEKLKELESLNRDLKNILDALNSEIFPTNIGFASTSCGTVSLSVGNFNLPTSVKVRLGHKLAELVKIEIAEVEKEIENLSI